MSEGHDKALDFEWVLGKLGAAKAPKAKAPTMPTIVAPLAPQADMKSVRAREMELYRKWKTEGKKPEDFAALYNSHKKLIQKEINKYRGAEVPRAALEFEHIKHYRVALESFDESKGVQLHSWITTNLKKPRRFVISVQNFARITEPLANKIGPFKSAHTELTAKLGHQPSTDDLVEHTGLSRKEVLQLNRQLRKALMITAGGDEETAPSYRSDTERQIADLIYHKLKPDEKVVHEYLFPKDGRKPITSSSVLAKKLGWHVSKVSKAKTAIIGHIDQHLPD
jgi:DNA-directed RNA polymerase sigma subunit (sigma70/sigma32)